jgi:repressor LexA
MEFFTRAPMKPLTGQQQKILDFIRQAVEESGFPPTRAEIARALQFRSPNAAEAHLRALEKKGVLEILRGAARGIKLTGSPADEGLPLIGNVAAGSPLLSEANVRRRCAIDPALFNPPADYLLQVRGLSMKDVGILDGDMLAVHTTREARDGQIVVARLNGEVTVKRLQRHGKHLQLLPENAAMQPIAVQAGDELEIEGIAVGVIRNTGA